MVSAVASTSGTSTGSSGSTAGLEAQLNNCRAQLGDWVTCSSAKTPAGKAKIAELSAKYEALKAQIAAAAKASAARQPTQTTQTQTVQGIRTRTDVANGSDVGSANRVSNRVQPEANSLMHVVA